LYGEANVLRLVGGRINDPLFFEAPQFVYSDFMSTAMVRIYTPEGFVIAADGYPFSTQKIFPAIGPNYKLAYGLVGWAGVRDDETGWRVSWAEECEQIESNLAKMKMDNMGKYAKTFTQMLEGQVTNKISQLRAEGTISDNDYAQLQREQKDSKIHFAGYFNGVPKMVVSRIHFDLPESSASLEAPPQQCEPDLHCLFGSGEIRKVLRLSAEPSFSQPPEALEPARHIWKRYRTANVVKLIERRGVSLAEAIEAAKDYIDACKDSEAIKIDKKACEEIAGHVHVATIKPNQGFEWVIQPKITE
jgi:hypothetical protein